MNSWYQYRFFNFVLYIESIQKMVIGISAPLIVMHVHTSDQGNHKLQHNYTLMHSTYFLPGIDTNTGSYIHMGPYIPIKSFLAINYTLIYNLWLNLKDALCYVLN